MTCSRKYVHLDNQKTWSINGNIVALKNHIELLELFKFLKATEQYEDTMTNLYNQGMNVTDNDSWCLLHNLNLLHTIFLKQNMTKSLKTVLSLESFCLSHYIGSVLKIYLAPLSTIFFIHCTAMLYVENLFMTLRLFEALSSVSLLTMCLCEWMSLYFNHLLLSFLAFCSFFHMNR